MSEQFTCPECDGAWLRDFICDHDEGCQIGTTDAVTVAADEKWLAGKPEEEYVRPCTLAELHLAEAWLDESLDLPSEWEFANEEDPEEAHKLAWLQTVLRTEANGEGAYRTIHGLAAPTRAEMGR